MWGERENGFGEEWTRRLRRASGCDEEPSQKRVMPVASSVRLMRPMRARGASRISKRMRGWPTEMGTRVRVQVLLRVRSPRLLVAC